MSGESLTFSILTPVLNGAHTIERAFESLYRQQYPHVQHVVFDGGSTDGTVEIIKKYENHIHYWQSKPDGGPNYNVILEHSDGDIIGYLNADDKYMPGILHKVADAFAADPCLDSVGFCYEVRECQGDNEIVLNRYASSKTIDFSLESALFGYTSINARFFRRSFMERSAPFRHFDDKGNFIIASDREFLITAALSQPTDKVLEHLGFVYYSHEDSMTFSEKDKAIEQVGRENLAAAKRLIQKEGLDNNQRRLLKEWYFFENSRIFIFLGKKGKYWKAIKLMMEDFFYLPWLWWKKNKWLLGYIMKKSFKGLCFKKAL